MIEGLTQKRLKRRFSNSDLISRIRNAKQLKRKRVVKKNNTFAFWLERFDEENHFTTQLHTLRKIKYPQEEFLVLFL